MELIIEIEKNFPTIEKFLSKVELLRFTHAVSNNLETYNFGLGTMIRLKVLRPKSILYKKFTQQGFADKDIMTMVIIRMFYLSLQYGK